MIVLGIETSCDETGIAVYHSELGLLGHRVYSQVVIHAEYGGVVPELASRDHIRKVVPLIRQMIKDVGVDPLKIDGIGYTGGPGLVGALLVGATVARSLAWAWGIPAVAVHHMEGHLLAPMLEENVPEFPFVALLISGGHTQLVGVQGIGQYRLLGESLDDAAGEAFDKIGKLLGLAYPQGPALARMAESGDPKKYNFPRPMVNRPGLDFSFSGLKTFAINTFNQTDKSGQVKADIAWAFQEAIADTLVIKSKRALKQSGMQRLVVAGGVSANQRIRTKLLEMVEQLTATVYFPKLEFCTDNGAMIAFAGCQRLLAGYFDPLVIKAAPRWPLDDLPEV